MARTTSRVRRPRLVKALSLATVPLALLVSAFVVSQASYAAYSSSTTNPDDNWTSGTVALVDDDANAAAFTVTNLKPGMSGSRCIAVTSTGSLASTVRLYATDLAGSTPLAASMRLTVTQGSGGSFGSCRGFTPLASGAEVYRGTFLDFGASRTSYATGLGGWTPTGTAGETRTYQLTWSLDGDAPDSTQGGTASGALVWETQS